MTRLPKNLFPLCQKQKVGVRSRVPLDEGGLTGTVTEDTNFEPGEFRDSYFRGDRKGQVVEHVASLKKDLAGVAGTLPEIALRSCLSHAAVTTVIPGMRRVATVESSCRASTAGPLDSRTLGKDRATIRQVVAQIDRPILLWSRIPHLRNPELSLL